jgi:hypothetical protein
MLQLVFLIATRRLRGVIRLAGRMDARLWPEIPRVPWVTTQLERDEMVFFIVGGVGVLVPILPYLLLLQVLGVRDWRALPRRMWRAEVGGWHGRIDDARSTCRIGQRAANSAVFRSGDCARPL